MNDDVSAVKSPVTPLDSGPSGATQPHPPPQIPDHELLRRIGLGSYGEARSFVGTEGFTPPEGPGTPQADIYSLGKVLYEIATGKDRQNFPEPPTRLDEFADREQLLELNAVVLKACESNVQRRYQSAEEMQADLALLHIGKSVRRLRVIERR